MPLYSHPAEIRDNGQASCKHGHTEYRHCSDNTITRKMSSANASSIEIVDNPKGKKVLLVNYDYMFKNSSLKLEKGTFS